MLPARFSTPFVFRLLCLMVLVMILAGCGGKPKPQAAIFWPPPPDEPRIQFLTGFSSSRDLKGKSKFSLIAFGGGEESRQSIDKPFGVAVGKGKIYISDTPKALVWVLDLERQTLEPLPGNASRGKLSKPTNLALDAEGNLYVADTGRKEVVVYDVKGEYRTAFGPRQGIAMKPADMAVDGDRLYVADMDGSDVKVLDRRSGKLLDTLKGDADDITGRVSLPLSIAVGPRGEIHLTNMGTGRVLRLDRDGHLLKAFGRLGNNWGSFARPRGIDVDEEGRIYVVDAGHGNGQIFEGDGQLLIFFGDPGTPGGSMTLPAAVAVTRENLDYFRKYADPEFELERLVFVTNQYSKKAKVGVYGLGRMKEWTAPPEEPPATAEKTETTVEKTEKKQ